MTKFYDYDEIIYLEQGSPIGSPSARSDHRKPNN